MRRHRSPPAVRGSGAPQAGAAEPALCRGPEEYFQFLCRLVPPEQQAPLVFAAEPGEGPRFRVRVREIGGSRSRRIEVSASDREAARGRALEEIGEGWKILDVEELRPPATDRAPGDEL